MGSEDGKRESAVPESLGPNPIGRALGGLGGGVDGADGAGGVGGVILGCQRRLPDSSLVDLGRESCLFGGAANLSQEMCLKFCS